MSRVCLPSRAFNDRRIKGTHLRVLAAIAMLGEGPMSHREIGAECGVVDRDLRRELRELEDFGYLVTTHVEGFVSLYKIAFEPIQSGDKIPGEAGVKIPPGENTPPGEESTPPGEKIHTHLPSPLVPPALSPDPPNPPPYNPPTPPQDARARGSRLPEDWMPDGGEIAYAEQYGFTDPRSVNWLIENFRLYWHARAGPGAIKVSWRKTWFRWIRTEAEKRANSNGRGNGRYDRHGADAAAHDRALDILRDAALAHDERSGGGGYPETPH